MKEGSSCGVGNTQVFWLWIEKPLERLDALEQDTLKLKMKRIFVECNIHGHKDKFVAEQGCW